MSGYENILIPTEREKKGEISYSFPEQAANAYVGLATYSLTLFVFQDV